jgi:hypothetical protein
MYFILKIFISAFVIAAVSEIAKKFTWMGALLAALPLTSLLAIVWLYGETKDTQKVIALSKGIFWMVLPSLVFFMALPILLNLKINFAESLFLSIMVTIICYGLYSIVLSKLGIIF